MKNVVLCLYIQGQKNNIWVTKQILCRRYTWLAYLLKEHAMFGCIDAL